MKRARHCLARTALLAFVLLAGAGCGSPGLAAAARAPAAGIPHAAGGTSARGHRGAPAPSAPNSPPLTSGTGSAPADGDEVTGGSPQGEADPLVSNGLGSPLCKGALGAGELPAASRRDCETSGFIAAAAPTADYGIDVHINTGALGIGSGWLLSAVQDLFLTPVWMALVWAVHAVVVMLEWCFTIDLLDTAAASVGRGLREMQATLSEPWLVLVLSIASVLALYDGLIRRRVAETVGHALLMAAMMVGGMWVIADPTGTVGALGRWANQASLGTLAVAARGSPSAAGGVLARSMNTVFATAIEAPWCYLEFGNVAWCRDPAQLDARVRAAGLRIAAGELSLTDCQPGADAFAPCAASGSAPARALEHSAELLREADSNGAVFLALPANGPARNSINEPGSLLRTICQSSEATSCRGPTAAQAEFRTNAGTWSRMGGLLLIAGGVLGLMLLMGFIALRLLAAAIFSLLYLLLAPGMVLAPALGESGRAVFRRWAMQLLGAVVSKMLFSFLLGVVLAVLAILSDLQALGWWTQWLLMSAFWWGAFMRRHQAIGLAEGALAHERRSRHRSISRMIRDTFETPRRLSGAARSTRNRVDRRAASEEHRDGQASSAERRERLAQLGRPRTKAIVDEQARRTFELEQRDARERLKAAAATQQALAAKRSQLERVRRAREIALAGGEARRAAELRHRGQRIETHIERVQRELDGARRAAGARAPMLQRSDSEHTRERLQERGEFLDAQAALPRAATTIMPQSVGRPATERRDYPALVGLVGYGRDEYERLAPARRRAVRLEVDRELDLRRDPMKTPKDGAAGAAAPTVRAAGSRAKAEHDAPRRRTRERVHRMPSVPSRERSDRGSHEQDGSPESSVMRDARDVAARRKRQLGSNRP